MEKVGKMRSDLGFGSVARYAVPGMHLKFTFYLSSFVLLIFFFYCPHSLSLSLSLSLCVRVRACVRVCVIFLSFFVFISLLVSNNVGMKIVKKLD